VTDAAAALTIEATPTRVLVVIEGDPRLEELTTLQGVFGAEGYDVEFVVGAARALHRLVAAPPALLLLHSLERPSAWVDLCRRARQIADIPVIIAFRLPSPLDAVLAFELGVNAYVDDPRRLHELVARSRAALRAYAPARPALVPLPEATDDIRRAGPVTMDVARREVTVHGRPVHLSRLEFDLLALLLENPGQVRSRQEILGTVWGSRSRPGSRSLDTHIRRLRAKVEEDPRAPRHLVTVHGFGIRFDPAPSGHPS
jgi:two-component system response regulator RegX3